MLLLNAKKGLIGMERGYESLYEISLFLRLEFFCFGLWLDINKNNI